MEYSSSCDDIKPLLSSFFDNELNEDDCETVVNHLNTCSSCSKELENIKELSRLLKEYAAKTPCYNDSIAQNVVNRINNHKNLTCNEVLEELSAYFDGEVNLKLHYLIKEHIESCPECNRELTNLKNLSKRVKAVLNEEKHVINAHICWRISEKLSPFLDKELPKNELSEISEHLLACQCCRNNYAELKQTQQIIKSYLLKSLPIPDNSVISVYSRLNRIEKRKELLRSSVALFIIALLSWFSVNSEPAVIQGKYSAAKISYAKTYLRSEDFLFSKVYSASSEGVLPVNYEND
jgi:anti-sigma factor RsiW